MAQEFTFTVNGVEHTTTQNKPLLRYLRDDLHIHSAKDGCSEGACGTCTIHVDGAAVKACVLTTALAAGRNTFKYQQFAIAYSGRKLGND